MKLEVEDLKKIHMLPGETLVVKCELPIPAKQIENFANRFNQVFPDNKLMFIPSTMEVYKLISEEK